MGKSSISLQTTSGGLGGSCIGAIINAVGGGVENVDDTTGESFISDPGTVRRGGGCLPAMLLTSASSALRTTSKCAVISNQDHTWKLEILPRQVADALFFIQCTLQLVQSARRSYTVR